MKIAVFYHCKISGEGIPSRDDSILIVAEQMVALQASGLANAADEIHIGVNGSEEDALLVAQLCSNRAVVHAHGRQARFEFPTLFLLRNWVMNNPDSAILYHHGKGVTSPSDANKAHHRRTMEHYVVWEWKRCVRDISRGFDVVGCNLVDPMTRPVLPGRYFAGNFWWSCARHIATLAPIPLAHGDRILAEEWILSCSRRPICMDYERPDLYSFWERCGDVKRTAAVEI